MFHLLGPIVDHTKFIQHNYTYAQLGESPDTAVTRHSLVLRLKKVRHSQVYLHWKILWYVKQLTPEEIQRVEMATRGQHNSEDTD